MSETSNEPIVRDNDAHHRYEIMVDDRRIGQTDYRDHGDQRVFFHTEVDDAFTGKGMASQLVERALIDTRAAGKRVVPVCPYVGRFLQRHQGFEDITDPATPKILRWLEEEKGSS